MLFKLVGCLLAFAGFGVSQTGPASGCQPLSKDVNQRIENYLGSRLISAADVRPSVKSVEQLAETCYRRVTMIIPGTEGPVVMYLSPDERFLTSTLYDLSVDPAKEVARIADGVAKVLTRDESPRIVGSSTRIVLVEFVDFQCPYSKRFAEWYSTLPESLREQTALVFKNLPLIQHQWARQAAAYAACANRQSPVAFRQLTDSLFLSQAETTPKNLDERVSLALSHSTDVDLQKLKACAQGEEGSAIVERDLGIAKQLNVNNTPTLFIDGRRVLRVGSAEELKHLIESELARTTVANRPDSTNRR